MTRAGVDRNVVLIVAVVVDDAGHGRPRVLDVVEVPPEVAGRDDGRPVGLQRGTPRGKAGQQTDRKVCKIIGIVLYPPKKITRNILSNDHLPSILTVMPDASW